MAPPLTLERANPFETLSREYSALPLGPWLVYPNAFLGAVYDDNVNQTRTDRVSGKGVRFVPSFLAQANDGIHRTTLYGALDGRGFIDGDSMVSGLVTARAGASHTYEAMPDLVVGLYGDYTRQRDVFDGFGVDHGVTTLNPTGVGVTPVSNPQTYNQFAGSLSVRKNFDYAFVTLVTSAVDIVYDSTNSGPVPVGSVSSPNGAVYTATARAGHWLGTLFYGYVEGSVDQRRYVTNELNSHGYRTVGGIGSDQIGLFRGEIYAGYQAEQYDFATLDNVGNAVIGGRFYYYPTPFFTLSASLDRSLGASLSQTVPGIQLPLATRVTSALLQANYSLAQEWAASARFGYVHSEYVGSPEIDNAWLAGATATYTVWQNFGVTLDYQFTQKTSNVFAQNFTRNVITLGASYRY